MVEWWEKNGPPVYMSVAGYLGLIPEDKKVGDLRELAAKFPGGKIS